MKPLTVKFKNKLNNLGRGLKIFPLIKTQLIVTPVIAVQMQRTFSLFELSAMWITTCDGRRSGVQVQAK